jgi:hypothetical protein
MQFTGEPLTKAVASRQELPAQWELTRNSHELFHASCIDLTLFLGTVHALTAVNAIYDVSRIR